MQIIKTLPLSLLVLCTGCMERTDLPPEDFDAAGRGLFIVCEGNFQYGNATLNYYNPADNSVQHEVFIRANGMKLGDVANYMTVYDNRAWIVVNNSHVIFAINPVTFKEVGRISDFTSPREICFVSPDKAYVSQLWDNRIFIINPQTYSITGYITVPGMDTARGSTEQMVKYGDYVYCSCWSYQRTVIKIDTKTDRVVQTIDVGIQPSSMALDRDGKLWVLTDGGYDGSPYGHETPTLSKIDAETGAIEKQMKFKLQDSPRALQLNATRDTLYWLNDHVWRMSIEAKRLPLRPFINGRGTKYYSMTIDPSNSDVYVADAIDYSQQGMIYRYTSSGNLVNQFYVGVNPGAFCWNDSKQEGRGK